MLFKHDYQITYYSNDQTLTSSNIYPRNLSTQCIVYLQSLQLCNFESWFCIKGSNTDPTHLLWLLSTEWGPHFSNESQNQAFEIMITISYDNLCFYNRFPVCFVCQVCLSRYGLFFFFGKFVFSFALWYSRFHGMESTFSLPYIAWVSCGNGWVHQVCTKWTGVTAMCLRLGGGGWGGSTNGPIFNLVMKIIRDCIRSVTGPENAHYSLNQSDASLKSITTWFFVCSRTRGITVGLLLFFNVYVGFDRTESLKAVMNRQQ